ncbi:hypothetical protein WN51_12965 [Melipona quadrifasciata]|uniref:Uncharacterized protein n=1 Tax=Melipona quadrifasciata TaxID=166423 RepID=A0A0N0U7T9_9HYME|nr:hypothetical protein WN51_12965 [Melipona quadrifasciata]
MAFAAARMILKDKRRKASKEDFAPRNRSKARSASTSSFRSLSQARNKPADGVGHVNQKGSTGQKAPLTAGQKVPPGAKVAAKPAQKPTAQKGQVKVTPKAASVKTGKNKKKGQRQQYDLIVTINLVSNSNSLSFHFSMNFSEVLERRASLAM